MEARADAMSMQLADLPPVTRARFRLDMTQRELAITAQVCRSHLARIETGHARPSMIFASRIAAALGETDIAALFPQGFDCLHRVYHRRRAGVAQAAE